VKILHILRSEPDDTVAAFTVAMSMEDETRVVMLYEGQVDWLSVVEAIFENDKVVCWW
jgi:hypothetical protein